MSSHVYLRSMGKVKKNSKDMQPANIKVQKDRIMCKSIGNQTDDWLILRSFWLSSSRTCLFFVLNSIQSSWAAKKNWGLQAPLPMIGRSPQILYNPTKLTKSQVWNYGCKIRCDWSKQLSRHTINSKQIKKSSKFF